MGLWNLSADGMIAGWRGRGKQAKIGPFDAFFLLLYHYKVGKDTAQIKHQFQFLWRPTALSDTCVQFFLLI